MTTTSRAWKGKVHTDQMREPVVPTTVLGNKVEYPTQYTPTLLQPFLRSTDREKIGINKNTPFIGCDIWNCYEVSFLEENKPPRAMICRINIPADSELTIESKSLKLYLNSLNMEVFKNVTIVRDTIKQDLENALKCIVDIHLIDANQNDQKQVPLDGICVEKWCCVDDIKFTFEENSNLLKVQKPNANLEERPEETDLREPITTIYSNLLRSNCKITNQPDWGTVFVHYKSGRSLDLTSFLQYIVSFRQSNHFHEEVCERIYANLDQVLVPTELLVGCFYTRRGGIDINPIRASHKYLINELFGNYISFDNTVYKISRQ